MRRKRKSLRKHLLFAWFVASFAAMASAADQPACGLHQQFSQTYSISTSGHLKLKNEIGAVYIRGENRTTILVEVAETACNKSDLDGIEIHVDSHPQNAERPDHVDIETRYARHVRNAVRVEYHVIVPRNISLDKVSVHDGAIEIADVNGHIRAKTDQGDVAVDGVQAASQMGSGHGSVRVIFARLSGGQRITSVRGDIHVTLPSDSSVDVEATTGLREITNDFGIPASDTARGHALTFRIGQGRAHLEMIAFAGAIAIVRADDDKPLSAVVNLSREQPARSLMD